MPNIVVLPGDGVGREVMEEALGVLRAADERYGLHLHFDKKMVGGASLDVYGLPLTEGTVQAALKADAVLLGAVGGEKWDSLPHEKRPEQALLGLRKQLKLFANLRPSKVPQALVGGSTLKAEVIQGIDLLVVRELTGGIYFGVPRGFEMRQGEEYGINTEVYSASEIERIAVAAFEAARLRRKKVTSVDKANVLESSQLWRKVMDKVHASYKDVTLSHMYVDNCAMQLVRSPKQFDVIVTNNLFGDILSDEAAMLTGSIGMLPSASLGVMKNSLNQPLGLYEPVHGSAPDIAGQGIVNPIAMISSAAMMLRYSLWMSEAAEAIEGAIAEVLNKGYRTPDILSEGMTKVGTKEMGRLIREEILKNA